MSRSLHTEALSWLRYGKQLPLVCTEVGRWRADVLGASTTQVVEVEVKKTRSDFSADFRNKGTKHYLYSNCADNKATAFIPNYLYFFVPESLKDFAFDKLEEQKSKAGLAVLVDPDRAAVVGSSTVVVKKPTKLHSVKPSNRFLYAIVKRMSSEICGRYETIDMLRGQYEDIVTKADAQMLTLLKTQFGRLEAEDDDGLPIAGLGPLEGIEGALK